jgi:Yip1 domain
MSTPSPIAASSAPEPQPSQPGLSPMERIIDTFIAPRKTFEDLRQNSSWWLPFVLSAVITMAFGILAVQRIDIGRFVQQQIERSPSAQKRLEQATPQQREQGIAIQTTITKFIFYAYPAVIFIGGLVFAAILMAIFNFILGGEVPFKRALAIVFYSFFPWNLTTILLGVSLLVSSDPNSIDLNNPMPTNVAFFMDPLGNKFAYAIAQGIDIFRIWAVVLLGLGFTTASSNRKPTLSTGITTMFIVYGIVVLISAILRVVFS